MVSEMCRKYSSVIFIAGEKIGSMLECRSLRSARVMASWADHDGQIKPTAAIRPVFVKFFVVSTIRFEEDIYQKHVFVCVNWCKEDLQRELYRRPVEIWKLRTLINLDLQTLCLCKDAIVSLLLHMRKLMELKSR